MHDTLADKAIDAQVRLRLNMVLLKPQAGQPLLQHTFLRLADASHEPVQTGVACNQ